MWKKTVADSRGEHVERRTRRFWEEKNGTLVLLPESGVEASSWDGDDGRCEQIC
jgi:hypothetical protein